MWISTVLSSPVVDLVALGGGAISCSELDRKRGEEYFRIAATMQAAARDGR
jgi:hypothetical protein